MFKGFKAMQDKGSKAHILEVPASEPLLPSPVVTPAEPEFFALNGFNGGYGRFNARALKVCNNRVNSSKKRAVFAKTNQKMRKK